MKIKLLTSWIFVIGLTACGGGGGGDVATPPPAPVATKPGGIWQGTSNTSGLILEFAGVITENGQGRFVDENGTQYILNNVSGNEGNVSLSFTAYAQFGFVFLDGSTVTTGSMTGTVVERTSFTGNYSVATGEAGTISLTYNSLYDRDSSLSKMVGQWDDSGYGTLTVDSDGTFFEQDIFGCVYDGQVSIINADYNVYGLTMTVSLCGVGFDGDYTGLGSLDDNVATDDVFIFQMNSDSLIFTTYLYRL